MDIRTKIINDYTAEIFIDGRHVYTVVDNNIRNQKAEARINKKIEFMAKRIKFGKFLLIGASILGMTAFLYILGIAGHSDFVTMVEGPDTWTGFDYLWRSVYGIGCLALAVGIGKIGDHIIRHP